MVCEKTLVEHQQPSCCGTGATTLSGSSLYREANILWSERNLQPNAMGSCLCVDKNQESPIVSVNPAGVEPDPAPPPGHHGSHRHHSTNGHSERHRHGSGARRSREPKEKDIDKLVLETLSLIRTLVDKWVQGLCEVWGSVCVCDVWVLLNAVSYKNPCR
jgi:hypothetical protein